MLEKRKEKKKKITSSKIVGLNYRVAISAELENLKDQFGKDLMTHNQHLQITLYLFQTKGYF